jgi:hypothetical protein
MSSAMGSSPCRWGQGGSQPWASAVCRSQAARPGGTVSIQVCAGVGRPASAGMYPGTCSMIAPAAARSGPAPRWPMRIAGGLDALRAIAWAWRKQIWRPRRGRASEVGDAHLVAAPGQISGGQIPGCAPGRRAMNEQQPVTHALLVSTLTAPAPLGCAGSGRSRDTGHRARRESP